MCTDEIKNQISFSLDFQYEGEKRYALREAEGQISKGSCVVLCGSSGCGKSTLLRCMNRLIPQFYEGTLKGFCQICGKDSSALSIGEAGRMAASVFQDPRSQFFTLNSETELAFGLENFGYSQKEIRERVDRAFQQFHLEHLQNRNVFALSSGERQIIAVLSAWAMDPDIFLLDEPTANLDQAAVLQLQEALTALKAAGKTLVISEHRLYYLTGLADTYWVMQDGTITRRFSASEMGALSLDDLHSMGLRTTDFQRIVPSERKVPDVPAEKEQIRAEHIRFQYKKTTMPVLRGVSMQIETGEVVGLVGKNGCGKTTFGKLLAGLEVPTSGTFYKNGKKMSAKALCTQSIFVMQETEFQFFTNSVLHEVSYGIAEDQKEEIRRLLKKAGLWELRNHHPFSLSGGQMQKLALLFACISPKPLVILDEPTAGLDAKSLADSMELIREMQKTKMVLIITHDPELIAGVCTRCIRMEDGAEAESFDLFREGDFGRLLKTMHPTVRRTSGKLSENPKKQALSLDPRAKLLLLLVCMIIGIGANPVFILGAMLPVLLAGCLERHTPLVFGSISLFFLLLFLYRGIPCTATSFLWYFFLRVLLIGTSAALLLCNQEAARTLAALRRMHVPEHAVMVCSVMFRFFPVLSADLHMMAQSIRTRGFFRSFREKLSSVPTYLEMILIPMVFRVIRIAEALSASAETRGISCPGKRESLIFVQFHAVDFWMIGVLAVSLSGSFIIQFF